MQLLEILNILFVAETAAAFGLLFFISIDEGMILESYGRYVVDKFWFKPLGGCQPCTVIWIGVIFTLLHFYFPIAIIPASIISNTLLIFRKIV